MTRFLDWRRIKRTCTKRGRRWILSTLPWKKAPLKPNEKGDYLLYYSPKYQMNDQEKLQNFTAVGKILDDTAYQVEMFEDFFPFRRDVSYYQPVIDCPIE